MDTLTHSLLGALAARAMPPGRADPLGPARRTWTGAIAAAFPDSDFATWFIDPLRYLAEWHRGPTHSLVMLPLWALLLGMTLAWLWRQHGVRWQTLALLCGAAIASHIAADVITSYGTQIFSPLSEHRAALYTTFIIDPWFSLIIVTGLAVSIARRDQAAARAALAVLLGYVGLQGWMQHEARSLAAAHAAETGISASRIHALAQPYTPFRWKLVIEEADRFHEARVDLAGLRLPLPGDADDWWQVLNRAYPPPDELEWHTHLFPDSPAQPAWIRAAWQAPSLAPYRRFAMLPVVHRTENDPGRRCVWFTDRRFGLPGLRPPFRYGMCEGVKGEA